MNNTIVEIKGLGKKYTLTHREKYLALRDTVSNIFSKKHKEFSKEDFWALRDINLSINQGDVLGIIGKNGSGKSTLLKILSKITPPTEGQVKMHGRVSSLLEVGTGFNPELTGRENIFLNGAILGMSQREIRSKFDEIVEFSGVSKFLDTPVKNYSSGMYVRLAFSVAAHLEPEILLVDEVLSVGDLEYQKKCMGKMNEVSQSGRTIFFVSHNMASIEQLCNCCMLLDSGRMVDFSYNVKDVISKYIKLSNKNIDNGWIKNDPKFDNDFFSPEKLYISDKDGNVVSSIIDRQRDYFITAEIDFKKNNSGLIIGYSVFSENGLNLFWTYNTDAHEKLNELADLKGRYSLSARIPTEFLNNGAYIVDMNGGIFSREWLLSPEQECPRIRFELAGSLSNSIHYLKKRPTILSPTIKWNIKEI